MNSKQTSVLAVAAFSMLSLSSAVHAAFDTTLSVTRGDNLYYTGLRPKAMDPVTDPDPVDPALDTRYFGHLLAVKGYPDNVVEGTPRVDATGAPVLDADGVQIIDRPVGCPDPAAATLTCFGTPGEVIDITGATTVYLSVAGSINNGSDAPGDVTDAAGASTLLHENALAQYALLGIWAAEDTSTNVADPLADLKAYRDNVQVVRTDGLTSDTDTVALAFYNEHPGFTPVGEEFMVVDGVTADNGIYKVTLTPPEGATHLILGFNAGLGGFSVGTEDTLGKFDVRASDSDFTPGHDNPVVTVAVTGATANDDGKYEVVKGGSLTFTATATPDADDGSTIAGYAWTVGGTEAGTAASLTHTFDTEGDVEIVVTATDSLAATGSKTINVLVTPNDNTLPVASFTATADAEDPRKITVDASASSDADAGQTLSYSWSFGDGGTATGVTASHTYAADGDYTVKLTVTDDYAVPASDTEEKVVSVVTPEVKTTSGGGGAMGGLFAGMLALFAMRRRMK